MHSEKYLIMHIVEFKEKITQVNLNDHSDGTQINGSMFILIFKRPLLHAISRQNFSENTCFCPVNIILVFKNLRAS